MVRLLHNFWSSYQVKLEVICLLTLTNIFLNLIIKKAFKFLQEMEISYYSYAKIEIIYIF